MNTRTRKRDIHDPSLIEAVCERIRTMPFEELDAMLNYRKPGVEVTNMNEELAEWYREQAKKRKAEPDQAHGFEAALAPIRQGFAESGESEEELTALLDEGLRVTRKARQQSQSGTHQP